MKKRTLGIPIVNIPKVQKSFWTVWKKTLKNQTRKQLLPRLDEYMDRYKDPTASMEFREAALRRADYIAKVLVNKMYPDGHV